MFAAQMQQIRQLLSKRTREEGNEWLSGLERPFLRLVLFLIVYRWVLHTLCHLSFPALRSPILACLIFVWFVAYLPQQAFWAHGRLKFCFLRRLGQVPVFLQLVLLLSSCRLGEATNPGPQKGETTFRLGAFNPSGLNGKAPVLQHALPPADCWLVSETHLSSRAYHNFKASLHFEKSLYRFCIPGHHAPARTHSQSKELHSFHRIPPVGFQQGGPTTSKHRAEFCMLPPRFKGLGLPVVCCTGSPKALSTLCTESTMTDSFMQWHLRCVSKPQAQDLLPVTLMPWWTHYPVSISCERRDLKTSSN